MYELSVFKFLYLYTYLDIREQINLFKYFFII